LGLGVGLLGLTIHSPLLAVLGFAGGLLHVLNHALFKGLLFLGAGSVQHGAGTLEIDELGGLLKRMPWTGALFLVGAVAICGLPPLNGFISEFLIYLGALHGTLTLSSLSAGAVIGVIAALALIGGLAAACFAKAFGIIFLGAPRSLHAEKAHEAGLAMRIPMLLLAAGCIAIGAAAPFVVSAMVPLLREVTALSPDRVLANLQGGRHALSLIVGISAALLLLWGLLHLARRSLLRSRETGRGATWGCGYSTPSPRMQYTASSFAQPLTDLFHPFLQTTKRGEAPQGVFPKGASFASHTADLFRRYLFEPVFAFVDLLLSSLRWMQQGRVQFYILYIVVTLFGLFLWKML